MSDFMDMMVEMLPVNSQLQKKDNPVRVVLDRTVGAYMDTFEIPYEQVFLTSASGGWLDAHGRDYGVPRRLDEDDEHYRQRIIYEKLDHLTPALLNDVYNVKLFTYRNDFDVKDNTLVSDNPHIVQNESFLGVSDEDTISILDKKFILDNVVTWINSNGEIEYILDTRGKNILPNYSKIYKLTNVSAYFRKNEGIENVKLFLPNATYCAFMFEDCSGLVNVDLTLPNAINCGGLFEDCSNLVNIDLELPKVLDSSRMFKDCSSLVDINLTSLNAKYCESTFRGCSSLVNVDLNLPNTTHCNYMFEDCSSLVNVKLNLPILTNYYSQMFNNAPNIETIDVTIPTDIVSGFKSYVLGLNLENLTSFKINGEEQL